MLKGRRTGGGKKKSGNVKSDSTDSSAEVSHDESSITDDSCGLTSAEGLSYQLTQISVSELMVMEEDTTVLVVSSITDSGTKISPEEKVAPVVHVSSVGDVETSLVSSIPDRGSTAAEAPVLSFVSGIYGGGGLPPLLILG